MDIRLYEGYLRNRVQLCQELGLKPNAERRETELAILSAGYRQWGREIVHHLFGSFAFAFWDEEERKMFCARDSFGLQSFYYCVGENNTFLCGIDLCKIVQNPNYRKAIDKDALQLYILFGYPVGEKTLYEGIRKLMPGCMLTWDGKTVQIDRWYSLCFRPDLSFSEKEWIRKIDQTLQDILNEDRACFDFTQCSSFLSGGVDSSYLLAASGVKDAVGIGFRENGFSEASAASATAASLGANFREVLISAEEYFNSIPRFLRNLELPLADPSGPAFALGCERAAGKTRLCLSGEGADEFFAGYYVYQRTEELGKENVLYCGCDGVMNQQAGMQLLGTDKVFPLEALVQEVHKQTKGAEPLSRMLAVDIALWLEGDILFSACRSSRANGIDLLVPFADRRMFELSAAIPSSLKRNEGTGKYILRKAAETRLSREIAFRRKIGFSVPARQWFRDDTFRPQIERALFGTISSKYFSQEILRQYWESFLSGHEAVWSIPYAVYIFVLWYESCFELN